jgi:hypothetical protein
VAPVDFLTMHIKLTVCHFVACETEISNDMVNVQAASSCALRKQHGLRSLSRMQEKSMYVSSNCTLQ